MAIRESCCAIGWVEIISRSDGVGVSARLQKASNIETLHDSIARLWKDSALYGPVITLRFATRELCEPAPLGSEPSSIAFTRRQPSRKEECFC
jgi:hypothetical protein